MEPWSRVYSFFVETIVLGRWLVAILIYSNYCINDITTGCSLLMLLCKGVNKPDPYSGQDSSKIWSPGRKTRSPGLGNMWPLMISACIEWFGGLILRNRMEICIPRTQMTSIFEGQPPPKTRPFPIKTGVIWVLGYISFKHEDHYEFCE